MEILQGLTIKIQYTQMRQSHHYTVKSCTYNRGFGTFSPLAIWEEKQKVKGISIDTNKKCRWTMIYFIIHLNIGP